MRKEDQYTSLVNVDWIIRLPLLKAVNKYAKRRGQSPMARGLDILSRSTARESNNLFESKKKSGNAAFHVNHLIKSTYTDTAQPTTTATFAWC
jgi:hypothetical protein